MKGATVKRSTVKGTNMKRANIKGQPQGVAPTGYG